MKFAFIDAEKAHHPVEALCRNLNVSRSGFYAWKRRAPLLARPLWWPSSPNPFSRR